MNLKKFLYNIVFVKNIHFRQDYFLCKSVYNKVNILIQPAVEDIDTTITLTYKNKNYTTTIPEYWLKNWKIYKL